jgi:hypothetical protein
MSISESAKRHRLSQRKIELDLYFLPDRLPKALRYPLDAAGGPDALIKFDQAEGHLSPASDQAKGWRLSLTICPPGEGHFMGIDLSISEAKKLREVLDYVIKWQEDLEARAQTTPKPIKKGNAKPAQTKKGNAKPAQTKKGNAKPAQTKRGKAKTAGRS